MDKETLRRLEKGREHYENQEFDKAEPLLQEVARVEQRFADVMNMLGVIHHDRGDVFGAQGYFERALDINPNYTEAALNLAVAYNEQGLYGEARSIYGQITGRTMDKRAEIEPFARGKLANMHADLGRAYAELQMYDKAIDQYREALVLAPDFVDIRTRLGQLLKDAGDIEGACRELELAKSLRPSYVPARVALGVAHFKGGDKESAKKAWREVLDIDPENKTAAMYIRMVEQLDEPDLFVDTSETEERDTSGELAFDFDGETSAVMPAYTEDPEKDED